MKRKIRIDVVSDVVCPWCYIGKRRLESALQTLEKEFDFEIEYHPFELNPEMPANGAPNEEYLTRKFGGRDRYESITGQVTRVAGGEGLVFDFAKQRVAPNTRRAHALVQLAKLEGRQLELVEALFKAYFTDGRDLSDVQTLTDLATAAGLDGEKVKTVLADENALLQVALLEQEMYKLGITGVPFYIINNRYGVSGAQSADTFVKALREVSNEVTADGASCRVDDPNC